MRWAALFDDLESQADAERRSDLAGETADRTRLELSRLGLVDRLRGALGAELSVGVAGSSLSGRLCRVGPDWALFATGAGEVAVALDAVDWWSGLPHSVDTAEDPVAAGLGLGHALRRLARDRATIVVTLRTGDARTGTIDRVGADFLDLAEHAADVVRRPNDVTAVRTIAFVSLATVRPA